MPPVPPCNSSRTCIVKDDEKVDLKEGESIFKSFTCYGPGTNLQLTTHKYEPILDDEVEVKVDFCGVCHTDLAFAIRNGLGIGSYPHTPGHEVIGHIVKIGAKVDPKRMGQRVGIGFFKRSCHQDDCEKCSKGEDNLCPKGEPVLATNGAHGGFGEIVRCEDTWAIPIPDSLDSKAAAPMLCGGCTVWSPFDRYELKEKKVGLLGLGGLGHLFCKFLKCENNEIYVFSHSKEEKEGEAKAKYGVTEVVDIHDTKRQEELNETLDFILVTSYENFDWSAFLRILKPNGVMCFVGWVHLPIMASPYDLIWQQRNICGSNVSSSGGLKKMFEYCAKNNIVADIEEYPMQDINGVLNKFIKEGMHYRAVLTAGDLEGPQNAELPSFASAAKSATAEWTTNTAQSMLETAKAVPGAVMGVMQSVASRAGQAAQLAKQIVVGENAGVQNREDLDMQEGETAFKSFTCFAPHTSLVPAWHKYPALKDDEVEIKVDYCGLCHTDLAVGIRNAFGQAQFPHTPGHEIIGRITKVGSQVDKKRIGQRVGVGFITRSCRNCELCAEGNDHLCSKAEKVMAINGAHGGLSEIIRAEDKWAIPIPDKLDSARAAPLMCAGCTVWSPFDRYDLKGKKLALIGFGGLGHLFCKFAKALGNEVYVFSHSKEEKEDDAIRMGVTEVIDMNDAKRKDELQEFFDYMCVTSYEDLDWAPWLNLIVPGGIMCFQGLVHLPIPIGVYPLIWKQRSVVGSCFASTKQIEEMLKFCADNDIQAEIEEHPMQEINGVINKFIKGGMHYRGVLKAGPFELGSGEGYPTNSEALASAAKDKFANRAASAAEVVKGMPETLKNAANSAADTAKQVANFAQQVTGVGVDRTK